MACTVPCTVRALYVHCAKHSLCNSASGGVEAHSLLVGSCEDERVFGLGLWHVQKGICSSLRLNSHKQKHIVLLCLLGSSFEDESVFGLRLWQVQKVVCSSLCLHIRKPKNLSRTESGFFKKNSHPVKLIAKKLACPLSPNSMLLHRFASKGLQKKQPFRFGCRHALGNNIDQGGAGGSGMT